MSRIIMVGDSNIYRNISSERLSSRLSMPTSLLKTTRLTSLEANLKDLEHDSSRLVVISAVSNILSDYGRGLEDGEIQGALKQGMSDFLELVLRYTESKEKVLMVQPIFRSEPKWFGENLPFIHSTLKDLFTGVANIAIIPEFKVTGVDLLEDGVHLVPEAGAGYIDHVVSCLLDVLPTLSAPCSSKSVTASRPESDVNSGDYVAQVILPDVANLKKQVQKLSESFSKRCFQDDVLFATHEEKLDNLQNTKMNDRALIIGLTCSDYPTSVLDRKDFLSGLLRPLVTAVVGDATFDVFPKDGSSKDDDVVPPFEMKFSDVKVALQFKRDAYRKLLGDEFREKLSGVSVYPKVTLGTRVRTEILRALSKKLSSGDECGYCPIHNVRPILHIGPMVDGKVVRKKTYTFVEAVVRYRHLLSVGDLSFAYSKVGSNFPGILRQLFLVLNDEDRTMPAVIQQSSTSGTARGGVRGRGTKRKFGGRGGVVPSKRGK